VSIASPPLQPGRDACLGPWVAPVSLYPNTQSGIGREFSLDGILDSFTQRKNVTVNLNTARRQ
jgi:hypothetical protein